MKTSILLLAACLVASRAGAKPASRLAAEWLVPGADSPKEFALVDQATGTVRFGGMDSSGAVTFRAPVSTGIQGVSDVAGAIDAGTEYLVLTAPDANRIALILPGDVSPAALTLNGFTGVGPAALGEIDSGSGSELVAASIYDGASTGGRNEVLGSLTASPATLAAGSSSLLMNRIEPFHDDSTGNTAAVYSSYSDTATTMGIVARSGAGVVRSQALTIDGEAFPVTDVTTMAPEKIMVGFAPGNAVAFLTRITPPVTVSSSFNTTGVLLPYPVSGILPVLDGGAGNISDGMIVIAADGSKAEWFRVNAAANGVVSTGVTFEPEGGMALTGLLPLPGVGLMKLTGPSATGPSTNYESYLWNGAAWEKTDSGELPGSAPGIANLATLLFYSEDPQSDESARLLGIQNAPDWTRRSSSPDPVPVSVLKESFLTSIGGLGGAVSQAVNAPAGTQYVVTNQVEPALSIAAMGTSVNGLFEEPFTVRPESGSYETAFQVIATFDDERFELLWRPSPAGSWTTWSGPIGVGYNIDLQFRLRNLASGESGEIVSRSYQIPTSALGLQDSDGDGVPDYVELGLALDPFGGADSDGDGVSDLAEIIDGTDPGDPGDFSPTPSDIASGNGFELVTVARNAEGLEMADAAEMGVRRLDGSLLARAPVEGIAPPLADGGARGARLRADGALPRDELVAIDSPFYFDLTNGTRGGREILRMVAVDPPQAFDPGFTPTGTDLSFDTASWITAAQSAAGSYQRVASRTFLDPADSAVSVLAESLVHAGLQSLRPPENPLPAIAGFTLFPDRGPDSAKVPLFPGDLALLRAGGFDFRVALDRCEDAKVAMNPLATGFYSRHAAVSESTPGMLLPVDALRVVLRGGGEPDGYVGAVAAGDLDAARAAFSAVLANLAAVFRPVETWLVEVPEMSAGQAIYHRVPGAVEVLLQTTLGERFTLEQGLGLSPGTRFSVTGFTDTPPFNGRPTMAVTSAVLALLPVPGDRDEDGNLLDDEWERFFFGATGQDAFSEPQTGYTLLQYFLDGLDPRGGDLPAGEPVEFLPVTVAFVSDGGGGFSLDFEFPAAYRDQFDFVVESSDTLAGGSFEVVGGVTFSSVGGDRVRASVPAAAATAPATFYRVRVALR